MQIPSTSKNLGLNVNPSHTSLNSQKKNDDPFLPLLYIPASMYKKNANQISKKSRSESRKHHTDKFSRNPGSLVNTLSNKSMKGNQKSVDEFELKAKKLKIHPSETHKVEELKELKRSQIAIFAGFRTTKGFNPKKPDKSNQDRMLITSKFNNAKHQWVFSVFDGHGTDGHKVSEFIRDNFCNYILKQKAELLALSRKHILNSRYVKEPKPIEGEPEDSLIYYSSVGDYTEMNNNPDHELEYEKLVDEHTIFRQIQNYTKNVLIKKTFESLNNSLK